MDLFRLSFKDTPSFSAHQIKDDRVLGEAQLYWGNGTIEKEVNDNKRKQRLDAKAPIENQRNAALFSLELTALIENPLSIRVLTWARGGRGVLQG
ncbi:hypothetical protein [Ktedonobacter racemifer]|uniref:Uncharacterized protein n=1 Tax=Ktedonobacter racemifer DSM 44963 TaxID=485913 RepID=D6U3A2_KTERA|nr:hypothetical protein [Ktedonobacter racemifer]EFH81106.1 hypothetical protein Krac_1791 [Ktedonobacter racemifer DSM 44963]